MAIFNYRQDRTLPLLTKLYQVSSEIGETPEEAAESELGIIVREWAAVADINEPDVSDIRAIRDLVIHILIPIMDSIADNKEPDKLILDTFNSYIAHYAPYPQLYFLKEEDKIKTPVFSYKITGVPDGEVNITHEFSTYILASLISNVQNYSLERCYECNSVYPHRDNMLYCSFRCRNRVNARRAYHKRFADYKAVKGK